MLFTKVSLEFQCSDIGKDSAYADYCKMPGMWQHPLA